MTLLLGFTLLLVGSLGLLVGVWWERKNQRLIEIERRIRP